MSTIRERITNAAFELLEQSPEGLRYSELTSKIAEMDSGFNKNTIAGTIGNLAERFPDRVCKPSRGLFRLQKYGEEVVIPKPRKTTPEDQFYTPFADWLVNEVEECTKAIALGGHRFRDRWGTPDVIGKREPKRSDIIQGAIEIVSAEIKGDATQLVTAFAQACAYCLFSHRSYVVVPRQAPEDEIARLDALCQVFGIGFVLFDSQNPEDPAFAIRVRPRMQQPDLFYTNKYMKYIEAELFS